MPFIAQSVFPIIKIVQTYLKLITYVHSFHLMSLQRKAISYLAIMTHHAEDICRILHMAKVFPIHEIMTSQFNSLIANNQTNKHQRQKLNRLSFDLCWSLISTRRQFFTGGQIVARD